MLEEERQTQLRPLPEASTSPPAKPKQEPVTAEMAYETAEFVKKHYSKTEGIRATRLVADALKKIYDPVRNCPVEVREAIRNDLQRFIDENPAKSSYIQRVLNECQKLK